MIGDSNPHPPSYTTSAIWWRDELAALVDQGVKVYGVQCGTTLPTRYFYEEMAAVSGGVYLTLAAASCITEMFLAVCYRQVSAAALERYCEDAEKSGGDIEEKRRLFGQLRSAAPTNSVKHCTYVSVVVICTVASVLIYILYFNSADWYDRANDRGLPAYMLEGDKWVPYVRVPSTPVCAPATPVRAAAAVDEPISPPSLPKRRRSSARA